MSRTFLPAATVAVLLLAAAVGGYLLGSATGGRGVPATGASTDDASGAVPPGHPAIGGQPESGVAGGQSVADPSARFTHFRVGDRNVKQLLPDGNIMWVGTSGGVVRYDIGSDEYELFDLSSGLLARGIFHLSKLSGRLAVGTYGGGLSIHDEQDTTWKNYNVPQGLGDAFVYDLERLTNGDLWIATWSGANRVRGGALDDPAAWELYTVENTDGGLPNDWVYGLAEGTEGQLWLATEGGLARYFGGKWDHWNHQDGQGASYELVQDQLQFSNDPARVSSHHQRQKTEMGLDGIDVAYNPNYIVALQVDAAGTVWAGTWGGGLARFDGERFTNYTVRDGLPANHIFALHIDPDGRLWVGTSNGLAKMTDDGFTTYTVADGLFSNIVFSMTTASDGSRWVGSYGGVARIVSLD